MNIERYEASQNAYTQTAGAFHVRAISGGLTADELSLGIGGFETLEEAADYADYLNLKLSAY